MIIDTFINSMLNMFLDLHNYKHDVKLDGGQAYDLSSDSAATVTLAT
jgi:hypothetical protein